MISATVKQRWRTATLDALVTSSARCPVATHLSRPQLSIALTREILTIRPSALNHLGLQVLEETSNHAEPHNALQAELPWVTEDVERLLTLYRAMARLCEGPLAPGGGDHMLGAVGLLSPL